MNQTIKVLDHGMVRLIDSMGSDLSIVRAARVSYDAEWRAGEDAGKDAKLINYLWKNRHTSPFESVSFTFEVKAPIFVLRQWMRHRTWAYNEVSARYSELPAEFYVPELTQITTQSKANKQQRTDEQHPDAVWATKVIRRQCEDAFGAYEHMIAMGIPRELARGVLPVNTYSHMFCTVSLLNLLKFVTLRSHEHAQHEIQVYSDAMFQLIKPVVPVAVAAFKQKPAEITAQSTKEFT